MNRYMLDMGRYQALARQAAAESCVLLENENNALPLKNGEKIAVYGRSAFHYYKSGLGSGGLVNTAYTVGILEALKDSSDVLVHQELLDIYEDWIAQNPYDEGEGWGKVPWSQEEMPVTDRMREIAKEADASLVFIGRTAGEDQDNFAEAGSYLLTEQESRMLEEICKASKRAIVILNVGNIIDMSWVADYHPQAVLCVWQGGQEGGNGVLDVLLGKVNACGKLTDTIAKSITDYPSTANFGNESKNYYVEDVYVGYRYFETFAKDCVLYPFGYGLSYTTFSVQCEVAGVTQKHCMVRGSVKNTGGCAGKETVQVYIKVPQGKLGNPVRKLAGFFKTRILNPQEEQAFELVIDKYDFASYDDSGVTGHPFCYVLEEGTYQFYAGTDVRSAALIGAYEQPFAVVDQLTQACAPTEAFRRMKPVMQSGTASEAEIFENEPEAVPLRAASCHRMSRDKGTAEIAFSGDKGYQLVDVLDQKASLDEFVAQMTDDDLIHIFRGEGMCSPRVTAGTAAAFGGVTRHLQDLGIPAACCSDGPSGIRMDCGTKAFSLPNGTALGCTFNTELVEALFELLGQELRMNKIDSLLGPGINIHRNPLNGRNFEYLSEDPYLTGKIAAAQIRAMESSQIAGTIKHFCANNQEKGRRTSDAVVSERALREIYLKGFEMVVRDENARSVMTTYGAVNGIWTAGNYELCTQILREEWGFDGIVMSDWWAEANYEGAMPARTVKAPMAAAQNDLYMCVCDAAQNPENDDMEQQLASGYITRGELQRNAKNILRFILKSPSILWASGRITQEEQEAVSKAAVQQDMVTDMVYYAADEVTQEIVIDGADLHPKAGMSDVFGIQVNKPGTYSISFVLKSDLGRLAQLPISVFYDNQLKMTVSVQGTDGETVTHRRELECFFGNNHYMKFYYGANGLEIDKVIFKFERGCE